jgi:hypothetical protein
VETTEHNAIEQLLVTAKAVCEVLSALAGRVKHVCAGAQFERD